MITDFGGLFLNNKDNQRKLLKVFLLRCLFKSICEDFEKNTQNSLNETEYYAMDIKVAQFMLHEIVKTGDYTLQGIATYARIPYDVVYDAACGINQSLSIIPWSKLIELYVEVKPAIAQTLIAKLLEMQETNKRSLSLLLNLLN